jgi:CheY-like chemotaxis protein
VIDPDLVKAQSLAAHLDELGFEPSWTDDPVSAVADYIPQTMDVIVVELEMPTLSGPEAIVRFRRRHPDLPAVLMSALGAGHPRIERALALPFVGHVRKPVDVAELIACLFDLVGRRARTSLEPDFRALFAALPGLFLVIAPDTRRTIIAANDAYRRATGTFDTPLVGRSLFELFPDDPTRPDGGVHELAASFTRAIATKHEDTIPVHRLDVRRADGGHEERWWSSTSAPLLDEDGNVRCVIHRVEDLTDLAPVLRTEDTRLHRIAIARAGTRTD